MVFMGLPDQPTFSQNLRTVERGHHMAGKSYFASHILLDLCTNGHDLLNDWLKFD